MSDAQSTGHVEGYSGQSSPALFTVALAVATYWLFVRGVHAAYLILGGGTIGAFFLF